MKRHLIFGLLALAALFAGTAESKASLCPSTPSTNSDCGYVITVDSTGAISGAPVLVGTPATTGAPFDGGDDALIGVINNSSAPLPSLTFTGSGNGGGLFDFDGDGICTFVTCTYPNPTGYEGPLNTFTNISKTTVSNDTGTVLFSGAGLAPGASTYFSLESSPASIVIPGPIGPGPSLPEPATIVILAFGLAVVITGRRYYI